MHSGTSLTDFVRPDRWPTPSAGNFNDYEDPEQWLERREELKEKGINSNGAGMPLGIAVKLWPTPTVQDSENDGGPAQYERNSIPLNAAVKMWPTPSYSDGKGGSGQGESWTGGPSLRTAVSQWPTPKASDSNRDHGQASRYGPGQQRSNLKDALRHHGEETGSLNPEWVEWLMGLPPTWTDPSGGPSPAPGPESASPTESPASEP
jgi:hypothetical protein